MTFTLFFMGKDIIEIENQLNWEFTITYEWFINIRLSNYFGENKTKSILFASKRNIKKVPKLNITSKNIKMKQHSKVTYLG